VTVGGATPLAAAQAALTALLGPAPPVDTRVTICVVGHKPFAGATGRMAEHAATGAVVDFTGMLGGPITRVVVVDEAHFDATAWHTLVTAFTAAPGAAGTVASVLRFDVPAVVSCTSVAAGAAGHEVAATVDAGGVLGVPLPPAAGLTPAETASLAGQAVSQVAHLLTDAGACALLDAIHAAPPGTFTPPQMVAFLAANNSALMPRVRTAYGGAIGSCLAAWGIGHQAMCTGGVGGRGTTGVLSHPGVANMIAPDLQTAFAAAWAAAGGGPVPPVGLFRSGMTLPPPAPPEPLEDAVVRVGVTALLL
jgi:hypothetical protein